MDISRRNFLRGAISTLPALAVATHCSVGTLIAKGTINPEDYLYLRGGVVHVRPEASDLDDCTEVFRLACDIAFHTKGEVFIHSGTHKLA